ncbi:MAG: HPr kinase/phosphatase C-terminal domain-containing protein [Steroidobacteraceae bacterium]
MLLMKRKRRLTPGEPSADPFQERRRPVLHLRMQLMGAQFDFETDSPRLLRIVRHAYSGLPPHRLADTAPRCLVKLILTPARRLAPTRNGKSEPPLVRPVAAGGILCGAMESANFVTLSAQERTALVVICPDMMRFPYHIRYEMLEFAVYVLAARVQGLVPLHAACIGSGGQGILLLGPSGSGKSTVSLQCLLQGLDFLAEDSVLISPADLLATGVANFIHVRRDSLKFIGDAAHRALVRESSLIRRRSGVEKLEIDLRRPRYRLAPRPLRISAVVLLSSKGSGAFPLLAPMRRGSLNRQLALTQQYAANQPGWDLFKRQLANVPAFELTRGRHPLQTVEALEGLLPARPRVDLRRREAP